MKPSDSQSSMEEELSVNESDSTKMDGEGQEIQIMDEELTKKLEQQVIEEERQKGVALPELRDVDAMEEEEDLVWHHTWMNNLSQVVQDTRVPLKNR